jgi:hypothetical protein
VAEIDATPCDESSHGSDVQEPAKDFAAVVAEVHEAEETHGGCEAYCEVWYTACTNTLEECWREAFSRECKDDSRTGVDIRVGRREHSSK